MKLTAPPWLLFLTLLTVAGTAAPAQVKPDTAVYVIARGRDTVKVEWTIREGDRFRILSVNRAAAPVISRVEVQLGADGAIEHFDMRRAASPALGAELTPFARLYASGDSIVEERATGRRLATAGRAHVYNLGGTEGFVFSLLPPLAERVVSMGDSLVGRHVAGALGPRPFIVRRIAPELASMGSTRTGTMRVRFAEDGRPVQIDAMGSNWNVIADRTDWMDPDSVVAMFAEMERSRPQGPVAPRESAAAGIAGARIEVDYGSPAKRGREIFGGIVPWNRVWRTGANLATHFRSDRDLSFAGTIVPAGEYTLWTLPAPSGWTLIVNRQTGQWGTDYEAAHDLARIPLNVRALDKPNERFRIEVTPHDGGGVLRLIWDMTEARAAFVVR